MIKKIIEKIFNKKQTSNPSKVILLVEDSEVDRTLTHSTLDKAGYRVFATQDGEDGFEVAKAKRPDLIILDCMLPGINGIELGKKIKNEEKLKNIPIIYLTSLDNPSNIIDCYEAGADQYLTKPIDPKMLISQVASMLQEKSVS